MQNFPVKVKDVAKQRLEGPMELKRWVVEKTRMAHTVE
jgi:hypothetical protein